MFALLLLFLATVSLLCSCEALTGKNVLVVLTLVVGSVPQEPEACQPEEDCGLWDAALPAGFLCRW